MIRVGICDDMAYERQETKLLCQKILKKMEAKVEVLEFSSGLEVLEYEQKLNVLILDEEMNGLRGTEVKKILEERGHDTYIVFLTCHDTIMEAAFGIYVCGFLKKPLVEAKLEKILLNLMKRFQANPLYLLETEYGELEVSINDIIYIESFRRYCKVIMNGSRFIIRKSISKIENDLSNYNYFRCHQSYIINLLHIDKIETDIKMINGDVVQLSRRKRSLLKECYLKFIQKQMDFM